MNTFLSLLTAQTLTTVFLAVVLWSLYARFRRQEINRWWAWAWTSSAVFLALCRIALVLTPELVRPPGATALIVTLTGFITVPLLAFGAVSFKSPHRVSLRLAAAGLGGALVLGALTFGASQRWADPIASFSVRHGVRTAALGSVLLLCAGVFWTRTRETRSSAAAITSGCCLVLALNQFVYGATLLRVASVPALGGRAAEELLLSAANLISLDIAITAGICLGMILLLVEEHQRAEQALFESVHRARAVADENAALQDEFSKRQLIERELRDSEDRYRDLVEHSEALMCTHDLEGRILSFNRFSAQALGYSSAELQGMSIRDLLDPEVAGEFDGYLDTIREHGAASGLLRVVTRSGERLIWAYRNTLRTDNVPAPVVRGLAHDVTKQVGVERALRRSEAKFASAFRSSPCAMTITSLDSGRFIDVNRSFERQTGFSKEEVLGRTSAEIGLWPDRADRGHYYSDLREQGNSLEREIQLRTKSGRTMWAVMSAETIAVGGERCVLSVGVDVTARKEAEARQRAIVKALPDWIFLLDENGVFVEFHARDQRHLLMPPERFIGLRLEDVLPPDLAARLSKGVEEALQFDRLVTLEYSLPIAEGLRFYEVRAVRSDEDRVLALVRDTTDQKRAEHRARELQDELAHVGRVTALGSLTGALAHEINQPLAAIGANAHSALRMLDASEPDVREVSAALGDIMSDSRRIDGVLRHLRSLLRKDRRDYARVDVNPLVSEVVALAHSDVVRRQITLDVVLSPELSPVFGDRIQLQQVVLNLLMNACEAVRTVDAGQRYVSLTTAENDGLVIVSVSDGGVGIADEQLEKMFEPFYTTSEGLGLGLSICRTIIDAHGGQLSARRNPDRGLTCWFSLAGQALTDETPTEPPVRMMGLGTWN